MEVSRRAVDTLHKGVRVTDEEMRTLLVQLRSASRTWISDFFRNGGIEALAGAWRGH